MTLCQVTRYTARLFSLGMGERFEAHVTVLKLGRSWISWRFRVMCSYQGFGGVGWDTEVGIATRYRLGSPGIEYRLGRDCLHPSRPALGVPSAPCTMDTGSLSRGWSGRGVALNTHPLSSAEVKERVELYVCSPLWAFMVSSRVNFTLPSTFRRSVSVQEKNSAWDVNLDTRRFS
jgi:hypothetical protein